MTDMDHEQNTFLARLDERQKSMDKKLDDILTQTTKTNGRLTKAEDNIQQLNIWQGKIKGSYNAIMVIGSIISVIIGYAISHFA